MTGARKHWGDAGWLTLLALPVVCCVGHALLLAVAAGPSQPEPARPPAARSSPRPVSQLLAAAAVVLLLRCRA